MDNSLSEIGDTFSVELPKSQSLDELLDAVIREIREYGEDLRETKFYSIPGGKPWLEIRDEPDFQESVLHFFNARSHSFPKPHWRICPSSSSASQ